MSHIFIMAVKLIIALQKNLRINGAALLTQCNTSIKLQRNIAEMLLFSTPSFGGSLAGSQMTRLFLCAESAHFLVRLN